MDGPTTPVDFDMYSHYEKREGPVSEYQGLEEITPNIKNIGWTLGNDCPYRCTHCYSMSARRKGMNMSVEMIERIVDQLASNGVETVNLGGNEPLFTNGPQPRDTLLPVIIRKLHEAGIEVGITTSGISLLYLHRDHPEAFALLNDVDVSFDSPFEEEHNRNRGARIYHQAVRAMELCIEADKAHSAIMCGMSWNFSRRHIDALVALAARLDANVRINPIKPVRPEHMSVALPADLYYAGFARLMELCDPVDMGEPPLAAVTDYQAARRCPCGRTSFRIHSITPTGEIHVSPCVYLHDYKSELDLLTHDLSEIVSSDLFRVFRQRNRNPDVIEGCGGCALQSSCGGGCAARAYLHHLHGTGERSMRQRDPYCPRDVAPDQVFPQKPTLVTDQHLVHMDYLCTWIGRPRLMTA
ncbi:MAG: radical SAM protein [Tistrella sp.]|jgi:radical SAM protein with 4Fe4S-binding SPASM domain|uniref:Radical SAM protein n=1 Tax=Tistrella mobilis TaxID=171437 RepID=A0A3B9IJN9_9PROT|nr:radical SAM protein [Tistrella sp.]MAD39920.1 radical SAM protein [Tistrella sp.]MBA77651.1 radical SAM protein [Tistrella sp.]HAE47938.1 radical SAM protein [Tistrella mobilis]